MIKHLISLLLCSTCYAQLDGIQYTQGADGRYYPNNLTWTLGSDGRYYASISSGAVTPIYTNSLHEINMTLWSNSVAEYLFDDVNSLSWTNGTTGYTNSTSYGSNNVITGVVGVTWYSITNTGYTNSIAYFANDDVLISSQHHGTHGKVARTLCAWVKETITNQVDVIMMLGSPTNKKAYTFATSSGKWYCDGWGDSFVPNPAINVDTNWHFHAIAYDTTNVTYYYDGIDRGSSAKDWTCDSTPIWIGAYDSAAGAGMQGYVDNVTLHSVRLPSNSIWEMYLSTSNRIRQ